MIEKEAEQTQMCLNLMLNNTEKVCGTDGLLLSVTAQTNLMREI
jgi:hypothetical protein